jgi:hypothetical protein
VLLLLGRRKSFFIPSFRAFCSEHILLKIKLIRYCELVKVIEKKKKEQIEKKEKLQRRDQEREMKIIYNWHRKGKTRKKKKYE